ncbi:hypothetical protein F511_03971 [Dorcoceras hygrometricum]|uniref:Uncharacterized protein n=1 Tax=Dorcoceras hygrometricum TaxID=472368 RepID=A0A2Z7B0F3_9LAMI|nr:hypothetical protein F511_03971 [Dorcoceras hygrometricum]
MDYVAKNPQPPSPSPTHIILSPLRKRHDSSSTSSQLISPRLRYHLFPPIPPLLHRDHPPLPSPPPTSSHLYRLGLEIH